MVMVNTVSAVTGAPQFDVIVVGSGMTAAPTENNDKVPLDARRQLRCRGLPQKPTRLQPNCL